MIGYESEDIKKLEFLVYAAQKRYVSVKEGMALYSISRGAFMDLATEAGAVRKISKRVLVNVQVMNDYIEKMYG